jgi:uncharacterized protein YeaO (DUF488 family)
MQDKRKQGKATIGMRIRTRRIYDAPAERGEVRILVDRVWPRGVSRERAALDDWRNDLAPSSGLRKWFGHDPDKWKEFKRRYFAELDSVRPALIQFVQEHAGDTVTLLFGAKDEEHNNAVALKEYLERCAGPDT